jgi:hypothetical protein
MNTNRGKIPYIVEQYTGSKYIGLATTSNYGNRYFSVNENYYGR